MCGGGFPSSTPSLSLRLRGLRMCSVRPSLDRCSVWTASPGISLPPLRSVRDRACMIFAGCGPQGVLWSQQLNEPARLPLPDQDRTLVEAHHALAGCLCPSGPDGEIDEWSIYDESLRRLVQWAEKAGCFLENLQPLKEGGREHDLTFDEVGAFWLKFTKPAAAGYVVS